MKSETVPPVTVQPEPGTPSTVSRVGPHDDRPRNRLRNGLPTATPLPPERPEDSPLVLISLLLVLLVCALLLLLFPSQPILPPGPLP